MVVDLRSDTVTQPSPGMRHAMAEAEVGDDVLGDDPTTLALERKAADLLGKEAAVFVPSGTMANVVAVRAQTHHGDEMIVEQTSHVVLFEVAAHAAISGVQFRTLPGRRGMLEPHLDFVQFRNVNGPSDQLLLQPRDGGAQSG